MRRWLIVLAALMAFSTAASARPAQELVLGVTPETTRAVDDASLADTITLLRERANTLGIGGATFERRGSDRIVAQLPETADESTTRSLFAVGHLRIYAYQPNLVDYRQYPAAPSDVNPPDGTLDLGALVTLAERSTPRRHAASEPAVYMFNRTDPGHAVAGPAPTRDALVARVRLDGTATTLARDIERSPEAFSFVSVPPGFVVLWQPRGDRFGAGSTCGTGGSCVLLHDVVGVDAEDVASASVGAEQGTDRSTVELRLTDTGRRRFLETTKQVVQGSRAEAAANDHDPRQYWNIAIAVDEVIVSNPYVSDVDNPDGVDTESAVISGTFTGETASVLAAQLDTGPLPLHLTVASASPVEIADDVPAATEDSHAVLLPVLLGAALVVVIGVAFVRGLGSLS